MAGHLDHCALRWCSLCGQQAQERVRAEGFGTGRPPRGRGPGHARVAGLHGCVGTCGRLLSGAGRPSPQEARNVSALWLPRRLCCLPRGAGGLRAGSLGSSVGRLTGAEGLERADSLPDGAGGPRVGPQAFPGGGSGLQAGGCGQRPGVWAAVPQTFQALAKPSRLGGHGRPLLHNAAVR